MGSHSDIVSTCFILFQTYHVNHLCYQKTCIIIYCLILRNIYAIVIITYKIVFVTYKIVIVTFVLRVFHFYVCSVEFRHFPPGTNFEAPERRTLRSSGVKGKGIGVFRSLILSKSQIFLARHVASGTPEFITVCVCIPYPHLNFRHTHAF